MIMNHRDRCLAQTSPYIVRFVFGAYTQRFYFGRDICFARQTVHRRRRTNRTLQIDICERHKTIDQFERYIIHIDARAQSVGIKGRGRNLEVDIVVTQVLIGIMDTIQFQLSAAVQAVSLTHDVHTDCRVGTKPFEIHRAVRETCIRCEHRIRLSFRHTNLHRTLYRRQVKLRKGYGDRRKSQSCPG